jgi:predicted TIM-barrel fold metal-dependent hydrolase
MKIDTHQHYWRYEAQDFPWISDAMPSLQRDCLPADVAPALHSAGVDAVLAVLNAEAFDQAAVIGVLSEGTACVRVV